MSPRLAAACCLAVLAACSKSSSSDAPLETVTITASRSSVVANGTNTVTLHVTASGGGPIEVTTTRGAFAGGAARTTVPDAAGDVALTTCNAAADPVCAGTALVSATRPSGAASVGITFGSMALCTTDCNADPACSTSSHSCTLSGGGTGTCTGQPPSAVCAASQCAPTQNPETTCGDGIDNDCNGSRDCADSACVGRSCPGGPTFFCQADGQCTDISSGAGISLSANRTRLPPGGTATATVTATVTQSGRPAANVGVTFTTDLGSLSAATATTGADGKATVTFTSSAASGTATVLASMTTLPSVGASLVMTMPGLGSIRLANSQYQVMGVRFSGYQETNQLSFQLLDTAGLAYPAGQLVTFTHQRLGDSFVGTTPSCVVGPPASCSGSALTNDAGLAVIQLTSGRVAGVVSVGAAATSAGVSASFTAGNLAIVGAKPSGAHITLDCTPRNVPALTVEDCSFSHYAGPGSLVTCRATFADRFNNVLGVPALATFNSEAGSMGPPATTPAYDPTKPPSQQTGLGLASTFINVDGGKLPVNVSHFGGEVFQVYSDACGAGGEHSPRDGLVTVIVTAIGEEGFVDTNGDGVRDPTEPFIDMGEPYLDQNDNNRRDADEPYVDVNNNQQYDGPNGVWDASTTIWAEARILYSDFASLAFSTFFTTGAPPFPTAPTPFSVVGGASPTTASYRLLFTDRNFNPLTSATSFTISTLNSGVVQASFQTTPAVVDNLGMTFTQQYCDHPTSPTACGNVCASIPCFVVTNVGNCDLPARTTCTGFPYGNTAGTVGIRGACSASSADTVTVAATLNNVVSRVSLSGVCAPPP